MAKVVYDVVANVGEYKNNQGETKKRYLTCGKVFENDKGQLSIKMECLPIGPDWSGWLSLYVPKEREPSPVTQHSAAKANAFVDDDLADIPF